MAEWIASFRGLEFYVDQNSGGGGRRGRTDEKPDSDTPSGQDRGRKARTFRITALAVETGDYATSEQIIDVLNQYGPGRFVDVHGKSWNVRVERWGFSESTKTQGLTTFQIEFVEQGDQPLFVRSASDTAATATASADDLALSAASAFVNAYKANGPAFVQSAGVAVAQTVGAALMSAAASVGVVASDRVGIVDAMRNFAGSDTRQLILMGVQSSVALTAALMPSTASRLKLLLSLGGASVSDWADLGPAKLSSTTVNRLSERQNQVATAALVRRSALAELARYTPKTDFDSYDEAAGFVSAAIKAYDSEMARAGGRDAGECSAEVFASLAKTSSAIVVDVTSRGASLARLTSVGVTASLPAVVLAYRLYGDATRADDIVKRNSVKNPLSLPIGQDIELLSV